MNPRIHAAKVIAKRRIFETLISPGYYIALTIGLLLGYFLITGFVNSIDSSGFSFQLNPVYNLIGRTLEGAFGTAFVMQLFAEGPFLFALIVTFFPVLIFLAINSVFRFGLEKKVGAIELLTYGPADGTAYFMASMAKDILMTLVSMAAVLVFLMLAALIHNLLLGPMVFYSLLLIFFFSIVVYAYGVLVSTLVDNSASAIALFLVVMAFFLIIIMGSFTIVSSYVRSLAGVFSWIVQWVSPFFYWDLALGAIGIGKAGLFVLSLALLCVLTVGILALSHIVLRIKGVRA